MGRRPKTLTSEQAEQLEALAAFLSKDQIADYFGIARNTLTAIMEREPKIAARFARGRARAIGDVAAGVISRAKEGDQRAAEFYLHRIGGWTDKQEIEVTSLTAKEKVALIRSAYGLSTDEPEADASTEPGDDA